MMYSLKYSQMESGHGFHLLEDPNVFILWLTPTWIMPLHAFLCNHNITITFTDCWHLPLCCKHGRYLMEPALTGTSFTSSEYEHINCVRMHLSIGKSWRANDPMTAGLPRAREHLHPNESLQTEKVSFTFFAESSPSSLSLRLLSSIPSASLQIIPNHHHRYKHTISSSSPLRSLCI
jgi:hypothetical protein